MEREKGIVVMDDREQRDIWKPFLRHMLGIPQEEISVPTTGKEAEELLRGNPLLIIAEVAFEGKKIGEYMTSLQRSGDGSQRTHLVLFTTDPNHPIVAEVQQAHPDVEVWEKPTDMSQLLETIRGVIHR